MSWAPSGAAAGPDLPTQNLPVDPGRVVSGLPELPKVGPSLPPEVTNALPAPVKAPVGSVLGEGSSGSAPTAGSTGPRSRGRRGLGSGVRSVGPGDTRPTTLAGGRRAGRAGARHSHSLILRRSRNGKPHSARRVTYAYGGNGPLDKTLHNGGLVRDIVRVVPKPLRALIAALASLSLVLGGSSLLAGVRARRLRRERERLLSDAGALQGALLPWVPEEVGGLGMSVAYRPSDGPAAGGDFYDAFELDSHSGTGGVRVGIVIGDVSGHGRAALARTSLVRHTVRAYLAAGLEPRRALRLTGEVLNGWGEGEFATVAAAVYDSSAGTLTYACAGHPPPVLLGAGPYEHVSESSSPPVGLGIPTGLRQTTLSLEAGSLVCFHTDGLIEARMGEGRIGRTGLCNLLERLPSDATAFDLLTRLGAEADGVSDDMAACLLRPLESPVAESTRIEELEVGREAGESAEAFLTACGVARAEASEVAASSGPALLRVFVPERGATRVEVLDPSETEIQASPIHAVGA